MLARLSSTSITRSVLRVGLLHLYSAFLRGISLHARLSSTSITRFVVSVGLLHLSSAFLRGQCLRTIGQRRGQGWRDRSGRRRHPSSGRSAGAAKQGPPMKKTAAQTPAKTTQWAPRATNCVPRPAKTHPTAEKEPRAANRGSRADKSRQESSKGGAEHLNSIAAAVAPEQTGGRSCCIILLRGTHTSEWLRLCIACAAYEKKETVKHLF